MRYGEPGMRGKCAVRAGDLSCDAAAPPTAPPRAMAMLALVCAVSSHATPFPAPFNRTLRLTDPPMRGRDTVVLQQLLRRAPGN